MKHKPFRSQQAHSLQTEKLCTSLYGGKKLIVLVTGGLLFPQKMAAEIDTED